MTRPGAVIVEELRDARVISALSTRNAQRRGALEAELLALADPCQDQATAPRGQQQSLDSFSGPAGGRQT